LRRRRKALHTHIGETIERLEAGRTEHAALLAYHFARSENQEKSITYALLAGAHAVSLHARAEATIHYEDAFSSASVAGEFSHLMIDAVLGLASIGASGAELARDNKNLRQARGVAETLTDKGRLSKVLYWLGRHAYIRGDTAEVQAHGQQSLDLADAIGDEELSAPPVNLLGRVSILQCEYVASTELMMRSTAQMRALGNKLEESTAAGFCTSLMGFTGRFDDAQAYVNRALELARGLRNPFAEAAVYFNRANIYHFCGESSQVHLDYNESREISLRIRDPFRTYIADSYQCWCYAESTEPAFGVTLGERAIADADKLDTTFMLSIAHASVAICYLGTGEPTKAFSAAENAIRVAEQTANRTGGVLGHRALALASHVLHPGNLDRVDEAMVECIRLSQEVDERPSLARAYLAYARLLHERRETERARENLALAKKLFETLGMVWAFSKGELSMG
jgi:tetratricopeptide (TPR) repeat protein